MSFPLSTALAISTSWAGWDSWSCRCLGLYCSLLACETASSVSATADAQCDRVFLAGKLLLPMMLELFNPATSCITRTASTGAGAVGAVGTVGDVRASTL